jgi:hypothetical protein
LRPAVAIASIHVRTAGTEPAQRRKPWIMPSQCTTRTGTPAATRARA